MGKDKKPLNAHVAFDLARQRKDIPDDKLREVAKKFNFKPKVFIDNYHYIVEIFSILESK